MKKLFTIIVMLIAMNASAQWVQSSNGISSFRTIYSLASNGNNIVAGCFEYPDPSRIFVSTNNGASWVMALYNWTALTIFNEGSNFYAGTGNGVIKSSNNGTSWAHLGGPQEIFAIAKYGDTIFAGTNINLYRTTNNGTNWVLLFNRPIIALAIIGNNIFAGSSESPTVWRSTNNGNNWDSTSLGGTLNRIVLSLAVKGSKIFAATQTDGVFVSSNNGVNWNQTSLSGTTILCLNVNGNNIFAGKPSGLSGGVYLSTNDGVNWNLINEGMGNKAICSLTSNSQYIFAGTFENRVYRRPLSDFTGIQPISTETPSKYSLSQNYPNPFNPITKIKFDVVNGFPVKTSGNDKEGVFGDDKVVVFGEGKVGGTYVKLVVYDIMGREVQTLVNERLNAGTYEVKFDGSYLNSGVYFYRLVTEGFTETKRMILLK